MVPVSSDFDAFIEVDPLLVQHEPQQLQGAPYLDIKKFADFLHPFVIADDRTLLCKGDRQGLNVH